MSDDDPCYVQFVKDLEAQPESDEKRFISKRFEKKLYHDMESSLACPKHALREDLIAAGFNDMADKVLLGDYDF